MYLGINATTGEVIVVNLRGVWLTRTVQRKRARAESGDDRGGSVAQERSWRWRNCSGAEERESTQHDLEVFGFAARFPGCMFLHKETARHAQTENCSRRIEGELRGTVKAEAAKRRVREFQDRAAERRTKRTKSSLEEGQTNAPTTNKNKKDTKNNEFEQQWQRGAGIKFKRESRRSENRQLQRRQWTQQGGQEEGRR